MAFVDSLGYKILSGQKQSEVYASAAKKILPNKSEKIDQALKKVQKGQDIAYKAGIAIGTTVLGINAVKKMKINAEAKSNVSSSGKPTAMGSLDNKEDKTIGALINEEAAKVAQMQEVGGNIWAEKFGVKVNPDLVDPKKPKDNTLLYIGGAIAVFYLLKK